MNKTRIDSVQLEMLWTRLISIVDEAAAALVRTSFSTIVRESNDFACVLTDARGYSLAQARDSIPSFIGTVPRTIRHFLDEFPVHMLQPGDILITNDIWHGTGHLPDITVAKPIFLKRRLVGFAGAVAHAPDIGGRIRSADAAEVFEEGLQIPAMKAMRCGKIDATFEQILRKNVRVPDQVMGDLYAQFTALHLMEKRLLELLREHRLAALDAVAHEIHGRTEQAMRESIRTVPDGTYEASELMDGFADPIQLRLKLTVDGSSIGVDFTGSSPQVGRAINACLAYTSSYVMYGIKAVLCPAVPNNDGALRPVSIVAPEASIVNSKPPAAGGARALVGHYVPMMVIQAIGKAVPEKAIATVGSPLWSINLTGSHRDGKRFTGLFFMNGGFGANHARDGIDVLSWPANISSTPVEVIEQLAPVRVRYRRYRARTAGRGKHNGGTGQEILFESRARGPLTVAFLAERTRPETAAAGAEGGEAGVPGAVLINGVPVNPKAQHTVQPGDAIELKTPGGGGFGPPDQRPGSESVVHTDIGGAARR